MIKLYEMVNLYNSKTKGHLELRKKVVVDNFTRKLEKKILQNMSNTINIMKNVYYLKMCKNIDVPLDISNYIFTFLHKE